MLHNSRQIADWFRGRILDNFLQSTDFNSHWLPRNFRFFPMFSNVRPHIVRHVFQANNAPLQIDGMRIRNFHIVAQPIDGVLQLSVTGEVIEFEFGNGTSRMLSAIYVKFDDETVGEVRRMCQGTADTVRIEPFKVTLIRKNKTISVSQFPLDLAWAYTIHKSQGLTLDAAVILVTKVGRFVHCRITKIVDLLSVLKCFDTWYFFVTN